MELFAEQSEEKPRRIGAAAEKRVADFAEQAKRRILLCPPL
jgi:hypothetical protein